MTKEDKLIHLYLWVCQVYDNHPELKFQRWSNNPTPPAFTDQELVTIYLWGHFQGHTRLSKIYAYISDHWREWFPKLPSYQAFNRRLNEFWELWPVLLQELWPDAPEDVAGDRVLDSLPVMLAVRGRAYRAQVAPEYADVGYCATKKMSYRGVKLHLLGRRQAGRLPVPEELAVTEASRHDLPVLQEVFQVHSPGALFGDKAYQDAATEQHLAAQSVSLCTPDKQKPRQEHYGVGASGLWSRFVSTLRQPIESIFNWLIEKTNLQQASRVRSTNGLLVHCYGKLTFAFFLLKFYP
jgi:hypothetical protein